MATANLKLGRAWGNHIATTIFQSQDFRLGLILSGSEVADTVVEGTDLSTLYAAEYAAGGWVRPTVQFPSIGDYNTTTDKWELPATTEWSFTGPSGGFSIKQAFVVKGGTTTPGNTTGILVGLATFSSPIVVASGATQAIRLPWVFYGV